MTITITLPPETERRLQAEAEATGKNISTLVVEAVEARLSLSDLTLHELLAPVHADRHASPLTDVELEALLQDTLDEVRAERQTGPGRPE